MSSNASEPRPNIPEVQSEGGRKGQNHFTSKLSLTVPQEDILLENAEASLLVGKPSSPPGSEHTAAWARGMVRPLACPEEACGIKIHVFPCAIP